MTIYYSDIIPKTPQELERFYLDLIAQLTGSGAIAWSLIDKTGSKLTDIATRPHSDLQNVLQGDDTSSSTTVGKHVTDAQLRAYIEISQAYATEFEDVGGNIYYLGKAPLGTATSAAEWWIRKIDTTTGEAVTTSADSNSNFDNVWDDRTSLTYG